jgi:mRNA-degrading endonuclease toxin of MazEF toxin-antitoxin module
MRNVTNNVTAQAANQETKRGRGRPRKPDAMSNAERQAAYRQRQRAASINVTVTKNDGLPHQMQILRAELSEARHALNQLRLEQEQASASAESDKRQALVLRKRLARAEAQLSAVKATPAGNERGPSFEVMLKLLAMACKRKPVNAQLAIRASDVWRNGVAAASGVSDEQMKQVAAALAGNLI